MVNIGQTHPLMFSLLAKMPSGRHPLNALKDQYFDRTRESELGLRMYVLILLAKCIDPRFTNPSIYRMHTAYFTILSNFK